MKASHVNFLYMFCAFRLNLVFICLVLRFDFLKFRLKRFVWVFPFTWKKQSIVVVSPNLPWRDKAAPTSPSRRCSLCRRYSAYSACSRSLPESPLLHRHQAARPLLVLPLASSDFCASYDFSHFSPPHTGIPPLPESLDAILYLKQRLK